MPEPLDRRRPTRPLTREQITPGWPGVVAALERVHADLGPLALKTGLVELLAATAHAMLTPGASPSLCDRAEEIVYALRRMPWDTPLSTVVVEPDPPDTVVVDPEHEAAAAQHPVTTARPTER